MQPAFSSEVQPVVPSVADTAKCSIVNLCARCHISARQLTLQTLHVPDVFGSASTIFRIIFDIGIDAVIDEAAVDHTLWHVLVEEVFGKARADSIYGGFCAT